MENKNTENNENAKSVLDGRSSDGEIRVSEAVRDGKLEFTFESKKSGLVFEEEEPSRDGIIFEADTKISTESVGEQQDSSVGQGYSKPAGSMGEPLREEFTIPEAFDAEAEERAIADESTKVWTTYVPRFTEVSDTYRMNDDPRPRPEKIERLAVNEEPALPSSQKSDIDPTVDFEEITVPDAVVVNLSQKAEEAERSFSIYKFSEREETEAPLVRERTVDDEREEIVSLVCRKQSTAEVEETVEAQEPKEADPKDEVKKDKKQYNLPDPEGDRGVQVVDYAAAATAGRDKPAEAPDGADDVAAVNKKGRITEYTAHMQRDVFKDKFLDSIMSVKIRFIAALVITAAMLLFENAVKYTDLEKLLRIETMPGAMAIADFHFALCIFVLALPEICRGVKHLVRGIVLPEITPLFSIIILFVYTLVVALEAPLFEYPLFSALFAIQGLAAILASCFKRSADFVAFKRASAAGEKRILDKKMTRTLERENIALDGAVDEYKSKTARIFKTTFVSDFFKRSSGTVENSRNVIITLATALLASLTGGIIAFFVGNGWLDAAITFAAIALFTTPAVSLLLHKLPFYHSALECECEESAIIGESSIYDYSGVDVMAFEDTDIFGVDDVNLKRIIHYGDVDNMMKAMRQMSAVFANVGGPLDVIFANSLDKRCPPATSPVIEADGISGKVDGRLVCAGTAEYMLRHGIQLPSSAASARVGIADSTKIMYGAEDGVVYVQFHIRYSFSEEFTMILPSLKAEKIVPLVYTRDPNITGELMKTLTGGDDCIRVMKKNTVRIGEDKIYRRISAGVVTSGDKIDAINVVLLTKKYTRFEKKLSIAELIAVGTGTVLSAVLAAVGSLGVSSLLFFGWQAIWCVALYIFSRNVFAVRKKENEEDDE